MTEIVTLISAYPKLRLLTNKGPVFFKDGVARVECSDAKDAASFIKAIKDNSSLSAYVRVANNDAQATKVAEKHQEAAGISGLKSGAQTSELSKPEGADLATPATIFAHADKVAAESKEESKNEEATIKPNVNQLKLNLTNKPEKE